VPDDISTEPQQEQPVPADAPAPAPGAPGAIAFFDLDGTLIIGNTQYLMVKFFRSEGVVSRFFVLGSALWFLGYKAGVFKVTEEARAKAASMLRGLNVERGHELMARFTDEMLLPGLHKGAAAALQAHRETGDRIVLISAALEPAVSALCARLGVADFVGAPCEIVEGRYTGRLAGVTPYGEAKAAVAADLMRRWDTDPALCWAYADHSTDLALLQSVGHPVAVNPKPELAEAARRAGWPILP
jgi:HAD superfamily hydrolase (TIGR01490 family)